jgi:hypothetical protein
MGDKELLAAAEKASCGQPIVTSRRDPSESWLSCDARLQKVWPKVNVPSLRMYSFYSPQYGAPSLRVLNKVPERREVALCQGATAALTGTFRYPR